MCDEPGLEDVAEVGEGVKNAFVRSCGNSELDRDNNRQVTRTGRELGCISRMRSMKENYEDLSVGQSFYRGWSKQPA